MASIQFPNSEKCTYFCDVQQTILQLYEKARSQTLDAEEVTWLDNQVRDFPFFSLAYKVLARHHMSNKSTIKNRALQKGALYALNRGMLKRYLSDVVPVTKAPTRLPAQEKKAPSPDPVTAQEASPAAALPANEIAKSEATAPTSPIGDVNAYLNMQVRLRTQRYVGKLASLVSELQKAPQETKQASADKVPAASTTIGNKPVAKVAALQEEKSPDLKKEAKQQVLEPVTAENSEYEIGAFSNFTFLGETDHPDPNEKEIDTPMHTGEAVQIQTTGEPGHHAGEIIFEEKERIVEVTVSPEELEKYFKGRLPVELNFSASAPKVAPPVKEEREMLEFSAPLEVNSSLPPRRKQLDKEKEDALIERFIEVEPSISRVSDYQPAQGDLSQIASQADDDEWVTETLAQIYIRQGNKARARKIYQKLALIFPEKSDYFAVLIAKLK